MIAVVAKQYGMSPYQVVRELDHDPEQLAIKLLPLYSYAAAKAAFDSAKQKDKVEWPDKDMIDAVVLSSYVIRHDERIHPAPQFEADCVDCQERARGG